MFTINSEEIRKYKAQRKFGLVILIAGLLFFAYSMYINNSGNVDVTNKSADEAAKIISSNNRKESTFSMIGFVLMGFGGTVIVLDTLALSKKNKLNK